MLGVLLKTAGNIDPLLAVLGPVAFLYLVILKLKNWSDTHPDNMARLLDKLGLHKKARAIWDKLAAKQAEEEANRYLGVSV
jgi:hypothetical protein